ncbi:adenylate cyclase [Bryobacterales bacterium F-183]|nr:adenylate cyclase [Bryobacterales bacterium F-183]
MTVHSGIETEIKIRVGDVEEIEALLRSRGFAESSPRSFESNTVWDTPGRDLKASGELVRLRATQGRHVLTYKGKAHTEKYKSREELESECSSVDALQRVFRRLGLEPMFRYEKYRTEFQREDQEGVVTVDETPIGNFIELEGEPAWIDRVASELGFNDRDYSTTSYGRLYLEHCERAGLTPSHMVFE